MSWDQDKRDAQRASSGGSKRTVNRDRLASGGLLLQMAPEWVKKPVRTLSESMPYNYSVSLQFPVFLEAASWNVFMLLGSWCGGKNTDPGLESENPRSARPLYQFTTWVIL